MTRRRTLASAIGFLPVLGVLVWLYPYGLPWQLAAAVFMAATLLAVRLISRAIVRVKPASRGERRG